MSKILLSAINVAVALALGAVLLLPAVVVGIGWGLVALYRWLELHAHYSGDRAERDRQEWKRQL